MKIHEIYYEYERLPVAAVMKLLDSHAFYWFIVIVTVAFLVWLIAKAWEIHSIPKKKGEEMAQASLIFWMALLGLIWKPLWIAAVVMIVVDWDALADWIRDHIVHPGLAAGAESTPAEEGAVCAADEPAAAGREGQS